MRKRLNKKARAVLTITALFMTWVIPVTGGAILHASETIEQRKVKTERAFVDFKRNHGAGWKLKIDQKTGLPKALYGSQYEKLPGRPEDAAKSFLNRNGDLLLGGDQVDLGTPKVQKGAGTDHVKFQQYYKGLKVFLSGIDVHLKNEGKVHYVKSSYKPLGDIPTEPAVTLEEALEAARREIGIEGALRGEPKAELLIYPYTDGSTLAWQLMIPSEKPFGTWLVFVDAMEGKVLFKKNIIKN